MKIPVELHLVLAEAMDSDTTLQDWINLAGVCRTLRNSSYIMFAAWLDARSIGQTFGRSHGTEAELVFLRRHLQSMCTIPVVD
jgi:hypothetical protein